MELPFLEQFSDTWKEWLEYRKQARYKKYTEIGLKKTFSELIKLSGNDESIAVQMIERAMANNWQGFNFKLPNNGYSTTNGFNKPGTSEARENVARNW